MKRYASLDVLRAVAILLMIQVHFVENLSPREASSAWLYDLSSVLGMVSAPLFTFLVGLSLWLWMEREIASNRSRLELGKIVIRRGLFLFGFGLAFAVVIWLPKEIFNWDILTLLGASTIILYFLRKWPPRILVGLAILILIISPPLRAITDYASHWPGDEYVYRFTMKDVSLGFLLHGYFPLLPWIVFALMGLAVGKSNFRDESSKSMQGRRMPIMGLVFIVLVAFGIGLRSYVPNILIGFFSEISFYPASTTYIIGMLGIILLGLWILHRWLDDPRVSPRGAVWTFLGRYSRFSLTTYIVHHAVHVWPILLLATWERRREPWWYYADAVGTPIAFGLALLFIAIFYLVLIAFEKSKKYSFEGILRWLSES